MIERPNTHIGRLFNKDFDLSANQPGFLSAVMTKVIPDGSVFEFNESLMGLTLMTGERFSFTTGTGVTTQTLTLTHPAVRNPALALERASVIVVQRRVGGVDNVMEWTTFTVTLPVTVNLTGLTAATAYEFDVYYLFDGGRASLYIQSADETTERPMLGMNIGDLNSTNQVDSRIGLRLDRTDLIASERFKIILKVDTPANIIMYDDTETAHSSPFARHSLIQLPVEKSLMKDWDIDVVQLAKKRLGGF